jgi:hypothetical protein
LAILASGSSVFVVPLVYNYFFPAVSEFEFGVVGVFMVLIYTLVPFHLVLSVLLLVMVADAYWPDREKAARGEAEPVAAADRPRE